MLEDRDDNQATTFPAEAEGADWTEGGTEEAAAGSAPSVQEMGEFETEAAASTVEPLNRSRTPAGSAPFRYHASGVSTFVILRPTTSSAVRR